MTQLVFFAHSWHTQTDQHSFEIAFDDGKVIADKLPPSCTRQNLANHLQYVVDRLREMDQIIEPPEGEDG